MNGAGTHTDMRKQGSLGISIALESRVRWSWPPSDILTPWKERLAEHRASLRSGEKADLNGILWTPGSSGTWNWACLNTSPELCVSHFEWGHISVATPNPCLKATYLFLKPDMLGLLTQSFLSGWTWASHSNSLHLCAVICKAWLGAT